MNKKIYFFVFLVYKNYNHCLDSDLSKFLTEKAFLAEELGRDGTQTFCIGISFVVRGSLS